MRKEDNEEEQHEELATEPQPVPENETDGPEAAKDADETASADPFLQIQELNAKIEEQKDKYLRLFADFDNYKKRVARERLELIKEAGKDVILTLLPTLDDFERAIKAAEKAQDVESVKEGMKLIQAKLIKTLDQKGLKAMETTGKDFDSSFHEAIAEVPAPNDELKGKVLDEVEKGYYLNDKIIRYAKVAVGK